MNILYSFVFSMAVLSCTSKSGHNTALVPTDTVSSIALCNSSMISISGVDNLPMPKFRNGIGNSHLTITTQKKEAQRWFNQGLNHLHSFWHLEAYRAFKQVIKLDSTCAMGYWGLAMCSPGFNGNEAIWKQAINRANSLKAKASPIEKSLIEASSVLVNEGLGANTVQKFRELYQKYPNEPEAIAFAAIMLRQQSGQAIQQEVKNLLEKNIKRFPNNVALLHYYIHVMEIRPEFAVAKAMAAKMIKIAPNASHLTHMPGHLYYLAGEYEQAIVAYEKALKQETVYHISEKIPYTANQNYIHNLQFLAVAQAETNQYKKALSTAIQLANLNLNTQIPNEGATMMFNYEAQILPALVHIRYGKWDSAIEYFSLTLNSLDRPINNNLVRIYFQVMQLYCQAMKATMGNQTQQAINYGGQLSQLMQQFEKESFTKQNTPEYKTINETWDIMNMARYELAGWIDNIDVTKPFNDAAWKEAINLQNSLKYDEPPRLMYPIEESLGKLHIKRKEKQKAADAFTKALQKRPKSKTIISFSTII